MKYFLSVLFFFSIVTFAEAQDNKLILEQTLISDLSEAPIYTRLTEKLNGKISWKENFKYLDSIEIYSITYLSENLKVKGILVKPRKKGKYPCVIYNRGGNKDFGALNISHATITLGNIAKEGYVVIASQYRGNGNGEGKEEFGGSDVNDIIILPQVLKEIKEADTEKIGMYGWSRGGMMTYISLPEMKNIKAAVVGGAISDMFSSINDRPEMENVLEELVPNYLGNRNSELKKRSAIKWVEKFSKSTPILILHGNSDWRVKSEQSLKLALEFDKNRIPYKLIIFEGGDHGISEHRNAVDEQVIQWLDKYLKDNRQLPNMEYHGS